MLNKFKQSVYYIFLITLFALPCAAEEIFSEDKWSDRIDISGTIEVEAAGESTNFSNTVLPDETASDITLATVELGIDTKITDNLSGHVLLLWEEDDTEPADIDEAFISIHGGENVPFYLDAGRMYVPFG